MMRLINILNCGRDILISDNRILKSLIPILLIVFIHFDVIAQNIRVQASLDTNSILIGQKTKLKLTVDYKTDQGEIKIDFPPISDTLIKHIEVESKSAIQKYAPDSSDMSHLSQSQYLLITSFDSGYYAIPPFKFIINGDSSKPYETEPLLLSVNTIAVDTTKNIKDIKAPFEIPFSWKELLPYIYWGIAGIAVLSLLIWLLVKYLNKPKVIPKPIIITPKTPPHITALERLGKLKDDKLWQQGKLKQYHSELSDILRQYIEHRFYINAMEQVTDEIMYAFRTAEVSDEMKAKLRQVLFLADLVKFAKEQPLPNENDQSMTYAIEFVNGTKKEIAPVLSATNRVEQPNNNPSPQ